MPDMYYAIVFFLFISLFAFILKIICSTLAKLIDKKPKLNKLFQLLESHDTLYQSLLAATLIFQWLSLFYLSKGILLILVIIAPYFTFPTLAIMFFNLKLPRTITKHSGKKIHAAVYYFATSFTLTIFATTIYGSYYNSTIIYLVWAVVTLLFIFLLEILQLIRLEYKKHTVPFRETVLGIIIVHFSEKTKQFLSRITTTYHPVTIYRTMTLQKAYRIIITIPLLLAIIFDLIGRIYIGGSTGSTFLIDFSSSLTWYLISLCLLKLITYNKKWLTLFSTLMYSCYLYIHCLWIYLQGTSERVEPERLKESLQGQKMLKYEIIEKPVFFFINVLIILLLCIVYSLIVKKQFKQKESTND